MEHTTGCFDRTKLLVNCATSDTHLALARTTTSTADYEPSNMLLGPLLQRRIAFVKFLLEEGLGDTEQPCFCNFGELKPEMTPLCWVAGGLNDLEAVQTLVQHGADVNASSAQTTPLHAACGNNDIDKFGIVRFLVENGADINCDGQTYLMISVHNLEICCFLLEKKASESPVDNSGNSALRHAILHGWFCSVVLLMEHGAHQLIRNEDGDDALQRAVLCDSQELLEYLIQKTKPTPSRRADMYSLLAATIMNGEDVERALPFWVK